MNSDILFSNGNYRFGLRTVGIALQNGNILIQREKGGSEYALPGGTVKLGETTEETLIREFKEETGVDITINRLIWTEENFWSYKGKKQQGVAFYYLIEIPDNNEIPDSGEFISQKDNCNVMLGWVPVENLNNLTVYPEFIKREINNIGANIKHFISKD